MAGHQPEPFAALEIAGASGDLEIVVSGEGPGDEVRIERVQVVQVIVPFGHRQLFVALARSERGEGGEGSVDGLLLAGGLAQVGPYGGYLAWMVAVVQLG